MTGSERPERARRLAEELGVDVRAVTPSGPGGQVTTADVRRAAAEAARVSWRRTRAPRVAMAAGVATVTSVAAADLQAALAAGVEPLAAVARACVAALGAHPRLNAWMGDRAAPERHTAVHLGIAVLAPVGVVVPVVRGADRMATAELAAAITRVTGAARGNRARPEELEGSTFTISHGDLPAGELGSTRLNVPEVALLSWRSTVEQHPDARPTVNLTLTVDRRAVDEAEAAAFLDAAVRRLEAWPKGS